MHSDVGGGNGNRGLNWIALNWMYENARRHGLPILASAVEANLADKQLPQRISRHDLDARIRRVIRAKDLLHAAVQLVAGEPDRPHNNPKVTLARIDDAGVVVG